MAIMALAGVAVLALVVWALTRTVQPAPSVMAEVPSAVEQPVPTNTLPPLDTPQSPVPSAAPGTSTGTPFAPPTDENASVKRISVADLKTQVDGKQVTVIDVRDKTSYINNHIPGSLHIPLAQIESQVSFLDKNKPIVTYCT
jgi:hypothetical protein